MQKDSPSASGVRAEVTKTIGPKSYVYMLELSQLIAILQMDIVYIVGSESKHKGPKHGLKHGVMGEESVKRRRQICKWNINQPYQPPMSKLSSCDEPLFFKFIYI